MFDTAHSTLARLLNIVGEWTFVRLHLQSSSTLRSPRVLLAGLVGEFFSTTLPHVPVSVTMFLLIVVVDMKNEKVNNNRVQTDENDKMNK